MVGVRRDHVRAPGWATSESVWSEPQRVAAGRLRPWALQLRAGGRLSEEAAVDGEPATSYLYVPVVGFDPVTGQGCGGLGFSWTAAAYLWLERGVVLA